MIENANTIRVVAHEDGVWTATIGTKDRSRSLTSRAAAHIAVIDLMRAIEILDWPWDPTWRPPEPAAIDTSVFIASA